MTPAKVNLPTVYRGLDYSHQFIWKNPDQSAVNLTGFTAELRLKNDAELIIYTHSNGLVLGGAAGTINIELTSTNTTAILKNTYEIALILKDTANKSFFLLHGAVGIANV